MTEHMPEQPIEPTQPVRPDHILMRPMDGIISSILHTFAEHTRARGRTMYQPEGQLPTEESE